MEYREFATNIRRACEPRNIKITNSFGVYDVYKLMRKNKWYDIGRPVKEHEFYTIIRSINKLLGEELLKGNIVQLPHKMGKLELRKYERGVSIVDGKLKITYPVNWSETLKLWFEDAEERRKKTLLRDESKIAYSIRYNKHGACFDNKTFYEFSLNRGLNKALKEKIEKGEVETLW